MRLKTYLSKFEMMVVDLSTHNVVLPEPVIAYCMLNSVNLPKEKLELALALVNHAPHLMVR